jgi:hypothetical protein
MEKNFEAAEEINELESLTFLQKKDKCNHFGTWARKIPFFSCNTEKQRYSRSSEMTKHESVISV